MCSKCNKKEDRINRQAIYGLREAIISADRDTDKRREIARRSQKLHYLLRKVDNDWPLPKLKQVPGFYKNLVKQTRSAVMKELALRKGLTISEWLQIRDELSFESANAAVGFVSK